MNLILTLGIIGFSTLIGASMFFLKKRSKSPDPKDQENNEVVTLTLRGLQDVDMICDRVASGDVVILGVRDLAKLDMIRLKRTIQQLKSYTLTNGGEIFALAKDFIVIVPSNMKLNFMRQVFEESMEEKEEVDPPELPTEVGTI
ncbi:MAG: cell division protein SepF [Asgard group archaeon]|nr:cell division protein SepF [Asgard group archaeon]